MGLDLGFCLFTFRLELLCGSLYLFGIWSTMLLSLCLDLGSNCLRCILQVLKMFIGSMRSAGDFGLDLLDLLFGSINVDMFEKFFRKPRDLCLGLVCDSIEMTLDHMPLRSEIVLCIVELVVDLIFSSGSQCITLLLENIDKSSSLVGQIFSKVCGCIFNHIEEVSPLGIKLGEFLGWRSLELLELIHGVGALGFDCDGIDVSGGK